MVSPRGGYACESEGCYAILPIELPTHPRIKLEQQVMQQNQWDGTLAQTRSSGWGADLFQRVPQKKFWFRRNFFRVPFSRNERGAKQERPATRVSLPREGSI
jgi:hypothetical protein